MSESFAEIIYPDWMPSALDAETIEREFGELLVRLGIEIDGDSNTKPVRGTTQPDTGIHQDEHEGYRPEIIILWASKHPVHLWSAQRGGVEVLTVQPGDIVKLWNQRVWHSVGEEARDPERIAIRAWVSYESQIRAGV